MHTKFSDAFEQIPLLLQAPLSEIMQDNYFPSMLTAEQVASLQQSGGFEREALALALLPLATASAQAAISHQPQGAIACGLSGNFYFGANLEFVGAAIGQTVHAEQSAVSHAWMRGEQGIVSLSVSDTPCGYSCQFLNELNNRLTLTIHQPGKMPRTLIDYLPDAAEPQPYNDSQRYGDSQQHNEPESSVVVRLFDKQDHGFALHGDQLIRQAISAANHSYTPYSYSPSGVAIETCQGEIYCGSYIENAAFNPSLPPLQVALNLLNLNGYHYQDIHRVVVAESPNAVVRQWQTTLTVLYVLGCQQVEPIWFNM